MTRLLKPGLSCLLLVSAPFVFGQIQYHLTPVLPDGRVKVTLTFNSNNPDTFVSIPAWAPGSYVLNRTAEAVSDITATSNGATLIPASVSRGKWSLHTSPGSHVTLSYTVPLRVNSGSGHMAGPSTYMYIENRKREACHLTVDVPKGGRIVTGLDENFDGSFDAPNYDTLADNPITVGDFILDTYRAAGRPHYICLYGAARNTVDRPFLKKVCSFVSSMETDMFGGAPYHKYVWHFAVNEGVDGGGGLEHLSSTEISMASGMGSGIVGVYSHEFFHLWNVKRIRSKALGPFDYTQLPQTGALWWLEGVTDYYSAVLLRRYGWTDDRQYFDEFARQVRGLRGNRQRFVNSPYEASYRVRDAAGGRGNSNGLGISYYEAGHQLGMIFDIELLERTGGKYSLDDVEKALWVMCKDNQPGFEEGEIRRELVKFGGEELGDLYDKVVMSPGELPIETYLAKVGCTMGEKEVTVGRIATNAAARAAKKGMLVTITEDSPLGFKDQDVIVKINGVSINYSTTHEILTAWNSVVPKLKEGDKVDVTVLRGTANVELHIAASKRTTKQLVIETSPTATPAQIALRNLWLSAHRK